jgi:hypothetical protein
VFFAIRLLAIGVGYVAIWVCDMRNIEAERAEAKKKAKAEGKEKGGSLWLSGLAIGLAFELAMWLFGYVIRNVEAERAEAKKKAKAEAQMKVDSSGFLTGCLIMWLGCPGWPHLADIPAPLLFCSTVG